MTSKECLEKLEMVVIEANNFNEVSASEFNECVHCVNQLEKDIKVLDIIKKHYRINAFDELLPDYKMTAEELKKLKELLS